MRVLSKSCESMYNLLIFEIQHTFIQFHHPSVCKHYIIGIKRRSVTNTNYIQNLHIHSSEEGPSSSKSWICVSLFGKSSSSSSSDSQIADSLARERLVLVFRVDIVLFGWKLEGGVLFILRGRPRGRFTCNNNVR